MAELLTAILKFFPAAAETGFVPADIGNRIPASSPHDVPSEEPVCCVRVFKEHGIGLAHMVQ